ncbi:MurR/RpiR family transcriptional regulator [Spiroplasma cantharicola]|uniref:RpiR family transcriptional regulator n=1 Tax=Spiroplasma cantharicola TaxID=362837 RepID=A0A0M4JRS9_9MOLU|nr:MurR/RpiR family transcriptional regulator [Spiroplasma cantharicola]ALD66122.1 RpiR family transcriptional regulator [Spiroplasma cantharicola]
MEELKFLSILKSIANKNPEDINSYIANFILNNIKEINDYSLEKFAILTNTSKPSIIRFCNKLGVSGFSELKFQIKNLIKNNLALNEQFNFKKQLVDNNDKYQNYLQIKNNSSNIVLERYIANQKDIKILLDRISKANSIYVFGMNLAYNISRNFVQRIRWLNKTIIQERDLNSIESYVQQINENDVVFILSLSGNSKYLIDFASKLKNKTYIFGLLGDDGEIKKYCDSVIEIPQFEDKIWDSFSIRGQCLIQILDYIYMDLTNYLLKKVQTD